MANAAFELSENNQSQSKRGGRRVGAGRKTGSATAKTREIADKAAEEGITPLEFMLQVMREEPAADLEPAKMLQAVALRFEAAKAAAPYIHPRLQAIEHTGANGGPVELGVTLMVTGVPARATG